MLVHELCHRFFGNFPNFFITAALQNVGQLPQISPEIIVMPCFPCSISFRKYVYTICFADVFLWKVIWWSSNKKVLISRSWYLTRKIWQNTSDNFLKDVFVTIKSYISQKWPHLISCQTIIKSKQGYPCYKMITSQDMPSEAQVKSFLSHRKVLLCSQDVQVFVF